MSVPALYEYLSAAFPPVAAKWLNGATLAQRGRFWPFPTTHPALVCPRVASAPAPPSRLRLRGAVPPKAPSNPHCPHHADMDAIYDIGDLTQATGRSKRTMQAAVRTYIRVTGDPVATVRRRNFQTHMLTVAQYRRIVEASAEVEQGLLSYDDVFARYADQPAAPAPDPLLQLQLEIADLREQIEGLTEAVVRLTLLVERRLPGE